MSELARRGPAIPLSLIAGFRTGRRDGQTVYTSTVTNPIHVLAISVLRHALSSTFPGPGLSERFRKALEAQTMPRDAPVLDAVVRALQATGYSPDDFEGNFGFNNLNAAVQQAIVLLQSGSAL